MGGRSGVDAKIQFTYDTLYSYLNCSNVRGLITVSDTDEVRDMPGNYGVPTTMAIYSPTGVKIADNWADLLDGTIDASLANGVLGTGADFSRWWSGSLEDGSIMQTCNGWTDQSGGTDGNRANTDATWIFQGGWIGSEDWGIVGICWP